MLTLFLLTVLIYHRCFRRYDADPEPELGLPSAGKVTDPCYSDDQLQALMERVSQRARDYIDREVGWDA